MRHHMRMIVGSLTAVIGAGAVHLVAAQGWVNSTGTLAYKLSDCGTVTLMSAAPNSNAVIAGIAARGLWVNTDGTTWTRLSDVGESDRIANKPSSIVYDPTHPDTYWESGNYGPGIYKTTDGGKTFHRLGDIVHNDSISVDFSDPERRTLLAGGHEQESTVYLSVDGGNNWKNVGKSIVEGSGHSSHAHVVDALTYLVNTAKGEGKTGGIYRSADGGQSWQRVSPLTAESAALRASNGALYWTASGRVLKSTNGGLTWTSGGEGIRANITPVELPDKRLVAVGQTTLVMSSDNGSTWSAFGPTLPYEPHGMIFSATRKAFFLWRGECKDHVAGNAIMKLDYDVAAATAIK
jgi:photosystem II stability/assembly factor-like uncharacterized protein